jgi:hypothetical protein
MDTKFADKELIEGMIQNDSKIIEYFFFRKCMPMFCAFNLKVYNRQAEINELINEKQAIGINSNNSTIEFNCSRGRRWFFLLLLKNRGWNTAGNNIIIRIFVT